MDIIHFNPFRTAGVFSSASAKELQKNKAKLQAYLKVGRDVKFETDFSILKPALRNVTSADEAFSRIQQSKDRVLHALFWFCEGNTFDSTAINYLKEGDGDKALEIWSKVTNGKEVNSKNFSSFDDIGTLKLLSSDLTNIQEGIGLKISVIESPHFPKFIDLVADSTYKINNDGQIELFVDEVLKQFKDKYTTKETYDLFSRCNGSTHSYLSKKFTEEPLYKIEAAIESTKKKRKEDKKEGNNLGTRLFNDTRSDLALLKSILGAKHLQYKMIADNLAKEIMQCGIDYFNAWKHSTDPSAKSLQLLKVAKTIGVSAQVQDRIKENFDGITDWAETAPIRTDIEFVTKRLKLLDQQTNSINNASTFLHNCFGALENIKRVLGSNNSFYLNISSAVVSNTLGMLIAVVNEEQESFTNSSPYYGCLLIA